MRAAARGRGCASGRRSSPSRRRPAAASAGCSTGSRSSSRSTRRAISTGELNRFLGELRDRRARAADATGRRLNLLYGTQVETRPPRFRLFVNDPGLVTRDYGYWVENRLRERFGLAGVPGHHRLRRERGQLNARRRRRRRARGDSRRSPRCSRDARATTSTLACRDPEQAQAIAETGRNPRYLHDVDLSRESRRRRRAAPVGEAELVALAVPSRAFAEVVARASRRRAPLLVLTKGLDPATRRAGSRTLVARTGRSPCSPGPNHAEEIAPGLPAAAVVASEDAELALGSSTRSSRRRFRVYVNDDVVGVELCAAAKNVIALAAGGVDGLGLGDNAKAGADHAAGCAEMARLGEAFGARPETFSGLAGMGDLIVTCWSRHSRNRRAGELIARGARPRRRSARDRHGRRGPRRPRRCSRDLAAARSASSCRSPRRSAPCLRGTAPLGGSSRA